MYVFSGLPPVGGSRWGQADQGNGSSGGVRPQTHDEGLVMKTSPSWVQTASQMRPGVWERARSKRAWASAQFTTFHQALM